MLSKIIFRVSQCGKQDSIVGAGSVVRGKFPDYSVIIGNPAKVVLRMNLQKFLYHQNPGYLTTNHLTDRQKKKIVKKHFGLG
jgi:serine acetyltransferase